MYKHTTLWTLLLFLGANTLGAVAPNIPISPADALRQAYIAQFWQLAVAEMDKFGIPASVTLAQGILESGTGQSELAVNSNNHFGIKCFNGWEGETVMRETKEFNENNVEYTEIACFCKFSEVGQSFQEHSFRLLQKTYAPLFKLEITDYKGWAAGLYACHYATDPNYPSKLIALIEKYNLTQYDRTIGQIANSIPTDVPTPTHQKSIWMDETEEPQMASLSLPEPPAPSQRVLFLSRKPVFASIVIR